MEQNFDELIADLKKKTTIRQNGVLSPALLNEHLNDYYGDYVWIAKIYADSWKEHDFLVKSQQLWYNKVYLECRAELKNNGEKTPTEKLVEAKVCEKYSKEVEDWNAKIRESEYKKRVLTELKNAWEQLPYTYGDLAKNFRADLSTSSGLNIYGDRENKGVVRTKLTRKGE